MTATFSEILDEAKDAYLRILQGTTASYTLGGAQYTYLSLAELGKVIDQLEQRVARTNGTRPTILLADISRGGHS